MAKDKGNTNRKGATSGKKWGVTKSKDKINNAQFFTQNLLDRMTKEIPKMSLISISTVSDKFKAGGALVRTIMRELHSQGKIVRVGDYHQSFPMYRGSEWSLKKTEEEDEAPKKGKKKN